MCPGGTGQRPTTGPTGTRQGTNRAEAVLLNGQITRAADYAGLVLTTVTFIAIPLLIWLGQDEWGDRTGLYAFLAGLVTVNAIWFRRLR